MKRRDIQNVVSLCVRRRMARIDETVSELLRGDDEVDWALMYVLAVAINLEIRMKTPLSGTSS